MRFPIEKLFEFPSRLPINFEIETLIQPLVEILIVFFVLAVIGIVLVVVGAVGLLTIISGIDYCCSEVKYRVDKAKNFISGEKGYCTDCRHCCIDEKFEFSSTGYFCRLSNCEHITEGTRMNCVEKKIISKRDLEELFELELWTEEGKKYIRASILGKAMSQEEWNQFFGKMRIEHPEMFKSSK